MQTVWSRSVRPRNNCRCFSCNNLLPNTLSRRTTTGILRKRLTAGDAFGLLLGPVLGGALIADTKAKDKRRREWDERIAAVHAEVEQIHQKGIAHSCIASRNLRRLPALNRCYSSAAATSVAVAVEEGLFGAVDDPFLPQPYAHDQEFADASAVDSHHTGPGHKGSDPHIESNLSQTTIEKCRRLQRLVAIKLAIRMILHIHIGKSPRYIDTSSDYVYDQGRLPQDANELIRHLKRVGNSLKMMNSDELRLSWRAYQSLTRGKVCSLDEEMSDLARQFRRGEMKVTELVERFAERLLSSSESPTVRGYIPFLTVLSRARFDELGFMVDGTMVEARLPYDRHAIFILLWQYGKNKEAHYFERLIKKLTTDSAKSQFGEQWLWRDVAGTLIPLPPHQDPQILQILIYTALKCNQPHRAEAWSTILASTRAGHMWYSHVIRNFLKYYAAHKSWRRGQVWMKTALDHAEALAAQGIRHLQRITFSMLDFCVAYGERALYRDILNAAGQCRLGVYAADPDLTLTQRTRDILKEWEMYHERSYTEELEALTAVERARIFKRKLQHIHGLEHEAENNIPQFIPAMDNSSSSNKSRDGFQELEANANIIHEGTPHISNILDDKTDSGRWKELCRLQQTQLDSLRRQLESLKSEHALKVASTNSDQDTSRIDAVDDIAESQKGIAFDGAAEQSIVGQTRNPRAEPMMQRATISRQPLTSSISTSKTISDQPASSLSPNVFPQDVDPPQQPSRTLPSQSQNTSLPTGSPTIQSRPSTIHEEETSLTPPSSRPTSALPLRSPTVPEIDRALHFCSHITNCLAAHIKEFPVIRPLHKLVSAVPRDLLIEISLDGIFAHLLRQMLSQREREIFWDNFTVTVREQKKARALAALEVEPEAGKRQAAAAVGVSRPSLHVGRRGRRPRPWRGAPRTAARLLQESGRKLEATKMGRGALRFRAVGDEKWLAVM